MIMLGLRSLLNRRFVSLLTILSIALSVCLIVGVDRLRHEARAGFANSADGIDLIVASRGNPVQILLATVFGVGSTGNAIGWETFEVIQDLDAVDWAVPISMGDNHRGFPVIGTSASYFSQFRHSGGTPLDFAIGRAFSDGSEAVLGAEVARRFSYAEGSEIVLAHGAGDVSFHLHDDEPFTVVGVLGATGTAVDRMVLVSLAGFDTLHESAPGENGDPLAQLLPTASDGNRGQRDQATPHSPGTAVKRDAHDHSAHREAESESDHESRHESGPEAAHDHDHDPHGGSHEPGDAHDHASGDEHAHHEENESEAVRDHAGDDDHDHDQDHDHDHDHDHSTSEHEAEQINAVYLGLVDRRAVLGLQRYFSEFTDEPLTAVMPNVALLELWAITGTAEAALSLMAVAVALAGMLGLLAMLTAALDARRREFAVLRSVGATPWAIFCLIVIEAVLLTGAGLLLGYFSLMVAIAVLDPILVSEFGLRLAGWWPSNTEWALMGAIFIAGLVASLVPALRVYRITLADGLSSGH